LWGTRLKFSGLVELAAAIGSDVPFFIRGGATFMRGRGDALQPLRPLNAQWLVLLVPAHDVLDKTRRLYGALEARDFSDGAATARAAKKLAHGDRPVAEDCVNGFERAAREIFPKLGETWAEAERVTGRRFCLSGAGPALFAFATDRRDAQQQARALGGYAVRTVNHARASTNVIRYP
jgi:4-diphosphocytidyl-2-C-methyl-D-erythritol kinase